MSRYHNPMKRFKGSERGREFLSESQESKVKDFVRPEDIPDFTKGPLKLLPCGHIGYESKICKQCYAENIEEHNS